MEARTFGVNRLLEKNTLTLAEYCCVRVLVFLEVFNCLQKTEKYRFRKVQFLRVDARMGYHFIGWYLAYGFPVYRKVFSSCGRAAFKRGTEAVDWSNLPYWDFVSKISGDYERAYGELPVRFNDIDLRIYGLDIGWGKKEYPCFSIGERSLKAEQNGNL